MKVGARPLEREGRRNLKQTGDATAPPPPPFFILLTNPTSSCCFLFLPRFQSGVPRSLPSCPPSSSSVHPGLPLIARVCFHRQPPHAVKKPPDIAFFHLKQAALRSAVPSLLHSDFHRGPGKGHPVRHPGSVGVRRASHACKVQCNREDLQRRDGRRGEGKRMRK